MTAFNVGDRVGWQTKDGWRFGKVINRNFIDVPLKDGGNAETLLLTLRDEKTKRLVERPIRSCCAFVPGPSIVRLVEMWDAIPASSSEPAISWDDFAPGTPKKHKKSI